MSKLMSVQHKGSFEAAHFLPGHEHCGSTHGHTYDVNIEVVGDVSLDSGMLIDFSELKKAYIIFDHALLNNFMDKPTVENIAESVARTIAITARQKSYRLHSLSVRVSEGHNNSAECWLDLSMDRFG